MSRPDLPPQLRIDRAYVERQLRGYPLAKLIRTVLHDVERLPEGPCLMVGNHGPLAIDTTLLLHAIMRDTGRLVRSLGDRMLFNNPAGKQLARRWGVVEGSPDNAHALFAHGDTVLVYPGGARETTRDPSQRYQLDWGNRTGFARVALQAQVPIVPVACIGMDDFFIQLIDRETVRESFVGRFAARFVRPDIIPPLYLPRLRATQFHYFFGTPIPPNAAQPEPEAVRAQAARVRQELEALLATGLQVRREKLGAKQHASG